MRNFNIQYDWNKSNTKFLINQSIKFGFLFFLQISHCGICLTDHDYFVIFINFHTLGHELLSCVVPPLTKRPTLKEGGEAKGRFCPLPSSSSISPQRMLSLEIKLRKKLFLYVSTLQLFALIGTLIVPIYLIRWNLQEQVKKYSVSKRVLIFQFLDKFGH